MREEEVIEYVVNWLSQYLKESGASGFVIGISGGIDSALTSALAAKCGAPLLCVEMPIYQHPNQINRAKKHIEQLQKKHKNVRAIESDLSSVFDAFIAAVPEVENEEKKLLALANARARLRMTTLYYYAGISNALVVGTGNKVEDFGVGFFTKYGDGGVDISPIADLNKSQVFALAEKLGIIEEILGAPPTDGLWGDDRTDEDQLGASYPELEWAMNVMENNKTELEGQFSERENEVLAIYRKLNAANQHKMNAIPVCKIPEQLK